MSYPVHILGMKKKLNAGLFSHKLHKLVLPSVSGTRYYNSPFCIQSAVFYLLQVGAALYEGPRYYT